MFELQVTHSVCPRSQAFLEKVKKCEFKVIIERVDKRKCELGVFLSAGLQRMNFFCLVTLTR